MNPLKEDLNHILTHTITLWDDVRNSRIFISGGTGFFGKWLLESFICANTNLSLNASAVVLTRNPQAFIDDVPHLALNPAVTLHAGDVRTFACPPDNFRFMIHAATDSNAATGQQAPLELENTIVEGTRHMLEFARQCGAESFLFTSSGAVYGKQPAEMSHIPEEFDGAPQAEGARTPYAAGKLAAESLCSRYAADYGLSCKIARCFAFSGPYLPLEAFAIGNFIRDAIAGLPITIRGDGTPLRSYLYSADLTIWLWTILFRGRSCRPYNVGSEAGLTIADLAARIAELLSAREVIVTQQPLPGTVTSGTLPARTFREQYVPSTQRAESELGLYERICLERAILSMAEWNRRASPVLQ